MVHCTEIICCNANCYAAGLETPAVPLGAPHQLTLGLGVGYQNDGANGGCNLEH